MVEPMPVGRRSFAYGLLGALSIPFSLRPPGEEWTFEESQGQWLPTVSDGTAYVVGEDGALHALDSSGERLWRFEYEDAGLVREPAVVDGECFTVSADDKILRIDIETGEQHGHIDVSDEGSPGPPLVYGGVCYVQTTQTLLAIDYLNDERLWADERGARDGEAVPATDGETLVVFGGETAYAYELTTGELLWELEQSARSAARAPMLHEDRVFLNYWGGTLVCADLETGERLWEYTSERFDRGAIVPIVHDDVVVISGRISRPETGWRGVAVGIDRTGSEPEHRWTVTHGGQMLRDGTRVGDTVILSADRAILAIDAETGGYEQLHNETTLYGSVLLADGYLYGNRRPDLNAMFAIELEDMSGEYGSRGSHAANAHHDKWEERARPRVDSLTIDVTPDSPEVGDEVTTEVTAHFESDIELDVTEEATLAVADGEPGENETVPIESPGTMTFTAEYRNQSGSTTLEIPSDEDDDTEDGMPGAGVVAAATAIGAATYVLARETDRSPV